MNCPVCSAKLKNLYYDFTEYTLCEREDVCPNGHYGEYFEYGMTDMSFEDGKSFHLHYKDSDKYVAELDEKVKKHGAKWKWKINWALRPIRTSVRWLQRKINLDWFEKPL